MADVTNLLLRTDLIDRKAATEAVCRLYEYVGFDKPYVVFADGPNNLKKLIAYYPRLDSINFVDSNSVSFNTLIRKSGYGAESRAAAIRRVYLSIFENTINVTSFLPPIPSYYGGKERRNQIFKQLWDNSYACFTFASVVFLVNRPQLAISNEFGFYCDCGPSIVFRDGSEFSYANYSGLILHTNDIKMSLKIDKTKQIVKLLSD